MAKNKCIYLNKHYNKASCTGKYKLLCSYIKGRAMVCEYKMMSEKNISCKYYKKGE
jgi:hypothetical protein